MHESVLWSLYLFLLFVGLGLLGITWI
jgi:hypothetical protein